MRRCISLWTNDAAQPFGRIPAHTQIAFPAKGAKQDAPGSRMHDP